MIDDIPAALVHAWLMFLQKSVHNLENRRTADSMDSVVLLLVSLKKIGYSSARTTDPSARKCIL